MPGLNTDPINPILTLGKGLGPFPLLHLGDYVTVNKDIIDLQYSRIINITNAVKPQDVPSFQQITDTKLALEDSIKISNDKITELQGKVTNILYGSEAYDSFKKVIDLVNAMDKEDDLSVAKSITLLTQSIADEEIRAIAEEGSILTNLNNFKTLTYGPDKIALDANDSRIEGIVTANRTDYDNKLLTEQTARDAADKLHQSNMITTIHVLSTPTMYADGVAPKAIIPKHCSIDGWTYSKTSDDITDKINWYFPPKSDLKFKDLNHLSFNAWLANNASLPFIVLYTKRKNDGNDETIWYRSKYVFEVSKPILINSTSNVVPYQFYIGFNNSNVDTLPNFGLQRKELSNTTISRDNKFLPELNDEIQYIAFSTNSVATKDSVDLLVSNLCYCTNTGITEYKFISSLLTSQMVTTSLESEVLRAKTAEGALKTDLKTLSEKQISDYGILDGKITGLNTSLSGSIGDESSRALAAEGLIAGNLSTHIGLYDKNTIRVDGLITNLGTNLTTETNTRVQEINRLTGYIEKLESSLLSLTQAFFGNGEFKTIPFIIPYLHDDSNKIL
jgi:hypothetical protein